MGAAETIQAAIDELESLKAKSTPGPWIVHDMGDSTFTSKNNKGWWWVWQQSALPFYGGVMEIDHHDDFGPGGTPIGTAARTDNDDGDKEHADADLIVTLHRTIDAQLTILRGGLRWVSNDRDSSFAYLASATALAEAILGEVTPDAS